MEGDIEEDPLTIEQRPTPTGSVIEQSQLSQAPNSAPAPEEAPGQVSAYARGQQTAPEKPNPVEEIINTPSAYTPQQVEEPVIAHQRAIDPQIEARQMERDQKAAQQQQAQAQKEENTRAKGVQNVLKDSGVEMELDPATGNPRPRKDEQGRTLYKPAVINPFEQDPQGNVFSRKRDRFGQEQLVPLHPKTDPDTGEKWVTGEDGVSRVSLGPDEDFIAKKTFQIAGQEATAAHSDLSEQTKRRKMLEKQILKTQTDAGMLSSLGNLTDDQRARLVALQNQNKRATDELAGLDKTLPDVQARHDQAQATLDQARAKMIERQRAKYAPLLQQDQPAPAAPAATPEQGVYRVDGQGQMHFSQDRPFDGLTKALQEGKISQDYFDKNKDSFEARQNQAAKQKADDKRVEGASLYERAKQFLANAAGEAVGGVGNALTGLSGAAKGIANKIGLKEADKNSPSYGLGPGPALDYLDSLAKKIGIDSDKGLAERVSDMGAKLKSVPGIITDPAFNETGTAKAGRFIGGIGELVAQGAVAPSTLLPTLFGQGFTAQHDAATTALTQAAKAGKTKLTPDQIEDQASTSGLIGGSINTVLGIPFSAAGKAFMSVFGNASQKAVQSAFEGAYQQEGAAGVAKLLTTWREAVARIGTDAAQEEMKQASLKGLDSVIAEVKKTAAQRVLTVAKRAGTDAAIGASVQVGQNFVTQQYAPETSTFNEVGSSALQ